MRFLRQFIEFGQTLVRYTGAIPEYILAFFSPAPPFDSTELITDAVQRSLSFNYMPTISPVPSSLSNTKDILLPAEPSPYLSDIRRLEAVMDLSNKSTMLPYAHQLPVDLNSYTDPAPYTSPYPTSSSFTAATVFAQVVFLCDGLFALKSQSEGSPKTSATRFFEIASQLPMELQMTLCQRVAGSSKSTVPSFYCNQAFGTLAHQEGTPRER